MKIISIIIPCYYNEGNIPVTLPTFWEMEKQMNLDFTFEYILVDDGSKDNTYAEMVKIQSINPDKVSILKLSRNFGSTNAVLAGMSIANGEALIFTAADMQTPPKLIFEMLEYWSEKTPVVYAHRKKRDESWLVKIPSKIYHWLMSKVLPGSPLGGFDSFLIDKKVAAQILKNSTVDEYFPSLLVWLGYPSVGIPYNRLKREIGTSQWVLSKKIKTFFDSFLGYSYIPIRFMLLAGGFFGLIGLIYIGSIVYVYFDKGIDQEGWASLMVILLASSALNFLFLGILGEYIWRVLKSSQGRANYIIDEIKLKEDGNLT